MALYHNSLILYKVDIFVFTDYFILNALTNILVAVSSKLMLNSFLEICLFDNQNYRAGKREGGEREREIENHLHLLVHSPNGHENQGWAIHCFLPQVRVLPGARLFGSQKLLSSFSHAAF